MANYTIGNATWTNGSHKVPFAVLGTSSTRTASFLGTFDSYATSQGLTSHVTVYNASTGWTADNLFDDPTGTYSTTGTSNHKRTCNALNAATYVKYSYSNTANNDYNNYRGATAGATKLTILLYTVGNNAGDWQLTVNVSSGTDPVIALPITPDGWSELTLDLGLSTTAYLSDISISKVGGAFFLVGDAVCVSTAYIHSASTGVPLLSDKISPDGTNWYTVDKVVGTTGTSSTGTYYTVFTKEAYTGTTGTYSTQRQEAAVGVSRDMTATVDGTGSTTASSNVLKRLISGIFGTSAVDSTLSKISAPNTLLGGVIGGISNVTGILTRGMQQIIGSSTAASTGGIIADVSVTKGISSASLGDATWTNGSSWVTFTAPNYNVFTLNESYPYTYPNLGGGINFNGTWGLNSGAGEFISARNTTDVTYTVPYASADGGLTNNSQACVISRYDYNDGPTHSTAGMHVLNIVPRFTGNTSAGKFSITATDYVPSSPPINNGYTVPLPATDNNVYVPLIVTIPNSINTLAAVSVFHTVNGQPYVETMAVDSVYLTNNSAQAIMMTDVITRAGDSTRYRIKRLMQANDGTVTLVLNKAYTGTSGTYDTIRNPDYGWTGYVNSSSSVNAGGLTRLQLLMASIASNGAVTNTFTRIRQLGTTIASTTAMFGNTTNIKAFVSNIANNSGLTSAVRKTSAFVSSIGGNVTTTASEFTRFKFFDAISNTVANVTGYFGQNRYFNSSVDGVSDITSNRTRLQMYTASVVNAGQSIVAAGLGYAKLLGSVAVDGVSSMVAGASNVLRTMTSSVDGVGDVNANMVLDIKFNGAIDAMSETSAEPRFIIGMMPSAINSSSSMFAGKITKTSFIETIIAAQGDVTVPFEWQPVMLFEASFSASGEITSTLVKELSLGGQLITSSELNSFAIVDRNMGSTVSGDTSVGGWLDVPETLRELIITSDGIIVGSDAEGNVSFNPYTQTNSIMVRGISIVKLNDVVNDQYTTIVIVE